MNLDCHDLHALECLVRLIRNTVVAVKEDEPISGADLVDEITNWVADHEVTVDEMTNWINQFKAAQQEKLNGG